MSNTALPKIMTNIPFLLGLGLVVCDVISIISAYYIGQSLGQHLLSFSIVFGDTPNLQLSKSLFFVLGATSTAIIWGKGLYTNRTPWWSQVQFIAKTIIFALILHGFISFSLKIDESRILIFLSWSIAFLCMILLRGVIYKLSERIEEWRVPTVIISDIHTAEDLVYAFSLDVSTSYHVEHIFLREPDDNIGFDASILPNSQKNTRICYGQDNHEEFIRENPQYFYVISIDTFRDNARELILKTLNDNHIPYAIVPTISRANLYQMEPKYFFGYDVVMLYMGSSAPQIFGTSLSRIVKRAMDIGVSSAALGQPPLLSP